MSEHDPLDERLSEAFKQLGGTHSPAVGDPQVLADRILDRPTGASVDGPRGPRASGLPWRFLAVLGAVALAGVATGAWAGATRSAPASAVVELGSVTLFDCPGGGYLGRLTSGDRIVLTGRTADSKWVELRDPTDLSARAWVDAAAVEADNDIAGLAVSECGGTVTTAPTSIPEETSTTLVEETTTLVEETIPPSTSTAPPPVSSTTVPRQSTTTAPPGPSPTPAPTPAPDRTGPTLSNVGASPNPIWTQAQPGVPCPPAKSKLTTTVNAAVSDPSGVASVHLEWAVNGRSGTANMAPVGGTWRGTIGPFAPDTLPTSGAGMNQAVTVTVRATDAAGNTSSQNISFELRSSAECFG